MVSKAAIFGIGAVLLLAVFASTFASLVDTNLGDAINSVVRILRYRKMDITSPEQLEQLMLCLQQRAINCDTVNAKGYWKLLKNTPFEGCPCGDDFMAGTDVIVNFKFNDTEEYTINDGFAAFGEVKPVPLKCNVRITDNWLNKIKGFLMGQSKYYLLFYNPNDEQLTTTIVNNTEGVVVVNTRWTLSNDINEFFGLSETDRLVQGCIAIKKQ